MRCWDSNSAARPDAKDLLPDVLDLRLDNDASTVQDDDGVEVVRVTTTTGCKQSSVARRARAEGRHPHRERERGRHRGRKTYGQRRLAEIGLDQRAARNVVTSLRAIDPAQGAHARGRARRADRDDVRDGRDVAPAA